MVCNSTTKCGIQNAKGLIHFFVQKRQLEFVSLASVFFIQGLVTDYTSITEGYLFTDMGYSLDTSTKLGYLINSAWFLRICFAPYIDRYVIGKEYLLLQWLFGFTCILWLVIVYTSSIAVSKHPQQEYYSKWTIFLLCVAEFAPAIGMTTIEKIMVIVSRKHLQFQDKYILIPSMCHISRLIGKCISSYWGAVELEVSYKEVFETQAILYFVTVILLFIPIVYLDTSNQNLPEEEEEEETETEQGGEGIQQHRQFILFMFCLSILPNAGAAMFQFLAGPIRYTPTEFGFLSSLDIVSIFGAYFTLARWPLSMVAYVYTVVLVLMNIPMIWILARQKIMDDLVLLSVTRMIGTFLESVLTTRFSVENTHRVPRGKEATYYAWYVFFPSLGGMLSVFPTSVLTQYFHVNVDNFEHILDFQCVCTIMQTMILFLPPYM